MKPLSRRCTGQVLALALLILLGFQTSALATTRDVKNNCGAIGDGNADDTAEINACISQLAPGDTLLFPAGTYKVSSQLTINVSNITVDGSNNTATILNTATGNGAIGMLIGRSGIGNTNAALGAKIALSTTANELATSFTTVSSLGASAGSYVYLQQGGRASSTGGGDTSCDPSGCRGEVLKVASVSGNTITVTTALHDTYNPSVNAATAQLISGMLSGVTVQQITFDGKGGANTGVTYGLMVNDVADSTITGVSSKNTQGSAVISSVAFNLALNNITITGAGSEGCGSAMHLLLQGNLSANAVSISGLTPGAPNSGCLGDGAFGVSIVGSANGNFTGLTVDASGASGRPFKPTGSRYNTFNNLTVKNGITPFNGISIEYYSSHNTFNSCVVTNNGGSGTGNGSAGINIFANYNQFNTFNNCTVTGNGNVQFVTGNQDTLGVVADSNTEINGGTYTGSNGAEPVVIIGEPSSFVHNANIGGPGSPGLSLNSNASNACVNNNTFSPGSGLSSAIVASGSGNTGSGNTLNGLNSNLASASCGTGASASPPAPPTGLTATVE